eukprot:jgi/Ulvmu1/4746/UM020_0030.1
MYLIPRPSIKLHAVQKHSLLRRQLGTIRAATTPVCTLCQHRPRNVLCQSASADTPPPTEALCRVLRVHYLRPDGKAAGFGLHVWGKGAVQETAWEAPLSATGQVSSGSFWDVPLKAEGPAEVGFIVHHGDDKTAGGALTTVAATQQQVWLVNGCQQPFLTEKEATLHAIGSLANASAHWVSRDTVLWRIEAEKAGVTSRTFQLHASIDATLAVTELGLEGGDTVLAAQPVAAADTDEAVQAALQRFPHLRGCTALRLVDPLSDAALSSLVQSQLCMVAVDDSTVSSATSIQTPGLLDAEFFYDGSLGDDGGEVTLWAPTAQSVELLHYEKAEGGHGEAVVMRRGDRGQWSCPRPPEWDKQYYRFRLKVYHYSTQRVEELTATDPYSRGLSADGGRSLFVDLEHDATLMPPGWLEHTSPSIPDVKDTSCYELHVRDFSASDESVPESLRGKYAAFDEACTGGATLGQRHLQELADSGLTHVHLLPTYDFGSVPERPEEQLTVSDDLSQYAPDGTEQQAEISRIASEDAFNWGYDPVHYGVPEGSYATDPDNEARIVEYRYMVKALHGMGLRVVQDVVYNHTFASGLDRNSVLDKVVPGYYHRRTESGSVCNSTCCNNTATEHLMAERLLVDDLVHWAKHFRIDGFRFDIMGHIMVRTMRRAQEALWALTLEADGVDGAAIYLYGEAWDFGEVACNQRGTNAAQLNIAGTGLGAFNDRFRDAALGGSPFGDPTQQGFLTGLSTDPRTPPTAAAAADMRSTLEAYTAWLKLGMAGNLREFPLELPDGSVRAGKEFRYGHAPAAYGKRTEENVLYLGCHDNEALYDQAVLKANHRGEAAACARVVQMSLGVIAVSQGIAFFHAGDELLRSKSLDRDSYNSGDWFNKLLWDCSHNNFGVGLPPASKNADTWPIKKALLGMPGLVAPPELITETKAFLHAMLRLRYSSPLFRLPAAAILDQVSFQTAQERPGVVFMQVESNEDQVADPRVRQICVLLNATPEPYEADFPGACSHLELHPQMKGLPHVDASEIDNAQRKLTVGPQTILVVVEPSFTD